MPVAPSYPGVYIEEIPSGVHTITGVATSIAAFVGWAAQGPTDEAQLVQSWLEYVRYYGGLDKNSLLGYAVSQFFNNGGQQAYIIRLVSEKDDAAANPPVTKAATAALPLDQLTISAKNPGDWANNYGVSTKQRSDDNTRFALSVIFRDPTTKVQTTVETFANLSTNPNDQGQRYILNVVNNDSTLLSIAVTDPQNPPDPTKAPTDATVWFAANTKGANGTVLQPNSAAFESLIDPSANANSSLFQLDHVDLFNLLCVPGETTPMALSKLETFCRDRRAFLIADCAQDATFDGLSKVSQPDGSLTGDDSINAAFYFPWIDAPDPMDQNRVRDFPPCGFVAGLYAKTDANRGVWKAPAGTEASLSGVTGVTQTLTDPNNGTLNVKAINCIRSFPVYGTVIWGARTLQGNDERGSDWKYIPVRRMALFLEETLYRDLKWVVFEPNDEPLWAQIRLNVGAFMQSLFLKGAFQGTSPQQAYFVKCDKETTTQNDINQGVVNIIVGFAPLKPAEFVVVQIQQMAGQLTA